MVPNYQWYSKHIAVYVYYYYHNIINFHILYSWKGWSGIKVDSLVVSFNTVNMSKVLEVRNHVPPNLISPISPNIIITIFSGYMANFKCIKNIGQGKSKMGTGTGTMILEWRLG